jgi:peptide deformylase
MILQYPDERLRQVSEPITDLSEVPAIVAAMQAELRLCHINGMGTLGLAAIQIGIAKRVVIVFQGGHQVVLVNPIIVKQQGVQTVRDGCLSVQGGRYFRGRTRPRWLQVNYLDMQGAAKTRRADGLHAAALAHELEHLDGVLFLDVFGKAA